MGLNERAVIALLETVGTCEHELSDIAMSWHSMPSGLSEAEGGVEVEDRGDEVVLHLSRVLQVGVDDPAVVGTEFEFRISAAIGEAGCRVSSLLEARLVVAFGGHAPGRYVLYETGSGLLEIEPAMQEFRSRVQAFDGHDGRLDGFGLVRGS